MGWALNEIGSKSKRDIDRKKTIGKAISVLLPLMQEMVRARYAQEIGKSSTRDVKEWERTRIRSYRVHTNNDVEYYKKIDGVIDSLGEYYPMEAQRLRDAFVSYQLLKTRSLEPLTANPLFYVKRVGVYDVAHMTYQFVVEETIYFLAFKFSIIEWAKIRIQIRKQRNQVPEKEPIFLNRTKNKFWTFSRKKKTQKRTLSDILGEMSTDFLSDADKTKSDSTS